MNVTLTCKLGAEHDGRSDRQRLLLGTVIVDEPEPNDVLGERSQTGDGDARAVREDRRYLRRARGVPAHGSAERHQVDRVADGSQGDIGTQLRPLRFRKGQRERRRRR